MGGTVALTAGSYLMWVAARVARAERASRGRLHQHEHVNGFRFRSALPGYTGDDILVLPSHLQGGSFVDLVPRCEDPTRRGHSLPYHAVHIPAAEAEDFAAAVREAGRRARGERQ